jgi:hypothetical protein
MAQQQRRGNREMRKPKAVKPQTSAPDFDEKAVPGLSSSHPQVSSHAA